MLFYFILKCGRRSIPDVEGQEFTDEFEARRHAVAVAHDLMRHREAETRAWRIQVCDDYLQPLFEVLFAQVDKTLAEAFSRDLRVSIKQVTRTVAAFNDAFIATKATMGEVQETLERARKILAALPNGARL